MLLKIEKKIILHIVLIPTYGAPEIKLEVNSLNKEILWRNYVSLFSVMVPSRTVKRGSPKALPAYHATPYKREKQTLKYHNTKYFKINSVISKFGKNLFHDTRSNIVLWNQSVG